MGWEDAWREGRTGWDAGASPPALLELVARDELPRGRALVPGCGAGYDVFTLARAGWVATGLDLAPTARARFEAVRDEAGLDASQADIEVADFFAFETESPYELVWDYTFLCAIEPGMRTAWRDKMLELVSPTGELVTLIFPVDPSRGDAGPPYQLSPELVGDLLEPGFRNVELEPVVKSHPGREGKEWLGRWRLA